MKYLLAIGIGPAQDFIASARRSRDLWYASWLLSEVAKSAALEIVSSEEQCSLIFPSPSNPNSELQPNSDFSVVNKIVAEVETENVGVLCGSVYTAMLDRLHTMRDDAFESLKKLKVNGKSAIRWEKAESQIDDLIEYYWVAIPSSDPTKYESVRKNAEALLAARKVTRNFRPSIQWADGVPKCSLDGIRESVIIESAYDSLDERTLRIKLGVRKGERLCGVCLLKRLGNRKTNDSFFSTSHVAALPVLERLNSKNPVQDYIQSLAGLLRIGEDEIKKDLGHIPRQATLRPHQYFCNDDGSLLYDGHLLFEERLSEFFRDEATLKKAKEALRRFFESSFGDRNIQPIPYYAILQGDGDRMGVAIDEQAKLGVDKHRELSQKLSQFAKSVKMIVEVENSGSCIYAGGDDVLALVPLHRAVVCARTLAEKFQAEMKDFPTDTDGRKSPTLSVGLAVGHHLDPLQDTLELARNAERAAKRVRGKNALAITVSKRSGIDRTIKGSWGRETLGGPLDERLNFFVFLHLSDELPDAAAFELQELAMRLKPPEGIGDEEKEDLQKAQRVEAKRILKRKQPKHGQEAALVDEVYDKLRLFIDKEKLPLEELAEEIIVARLFADAVNQAGTKAEIFAQQNNIKPTLNAEVSQ